MKRLSQILLPLFVTLLPCNVFAENILYHTYRATVSITVASLETNQEGKKVIVTRRFTNKQISNFSQGRAPEATVPKNELLVALLPDDYRRSDQVRLALMDRNTSSVIKVILTSNTSELGFGGPGGNLSKGVQSITVAALGSPANSLGPANGTGSFEGSERPSSFGQIASGKVISITLPLDLKLNGVTRPSIVTGGSVRISGTNLLDLYADL